MKLQRKLLQGVAKAIIIGTLSIATTSCGGGGGNTSGGASGVVPPPPPPPTNQAPSPSAKVNNPSPQEGQPFELDASESSDPEGETLTYSWSQTAGPTIALSDTTSQTIALNAPEVTQDETATFQLSVSDGTNTATQTVDVVFTNIAQTPVFPVSFVNQIEAVFQEKPRGIFELGKTTSETYLSFAESESSNVSLRRIDTNTADEIMLSATTFFQNSFEQPVNFHADRLTVLSSRFGEQDQIEIIEESNNKVITSIVSFSNGSDFELNLQAPCSVARVGFPIRNDSTFFNNGLLIGQRNAGLTLAAGYTDLIPLPSASESFCAVGLLPNSITGEALNDNPRDPDIIAVDTDSHMISLYSSSAITSQDDTNYTLREKVSVNLDTTEDLEFITSTPIKIDDRQDSGLILVYSNNEHAGVHRIVFVGIDANREIYQETYQWDIGVPSDVTLGSVDSPFGITANEFLPYEVVVLSSTSPQAIVFQGSNTSNFLQPEPGVNIPDSILPIAGTYFLEVGLGAESIDIHSNGFGNHGLFITYPEQRRLTFSQIAHPSQ